ncbi:T9SS type A sorting domain-containing protein, partial [candidate division WOR-3 bacterium]|nr:T9SS type A sorting domain-containing protein [candidate division WOR-3 bacterium]
IFIENITNWFGVGVEEEHVEFVYKLPMISPNPLSSSTTINFTIPKNEHISVKIYDITGSLISKLVDENLNSGTHYLIIDTDNLSSGVYFLKMDTGNLCHTAKFLVLK